MTPEELKDFTLAARQIALQYQLEAFSDTQTKQLQKAILDAGKVVIGRANDARTAGQAQQAFNDLQVLNAALKQKTGESIANLSFATFSFSAVEMGKALTFDGLADNVSFTMLSPAQIRAAVNAPIGGGLLEDWVERVFNSTMPRGELLSQYLAGSSVAGFTDALSEKFLLDARSAETLARTWINRASNDATMEVYNQNRDVITKVEWSSVMEIDTSAPGRGTCIRCLALDGRQYEFDDPDKPPMPLHPRCRCHWKSVTKSYRELGLDIDEIEKVARPYVINDQLTKKVGQFEGSSESWLKRQTKKYQESVLGVKRTEKFRAGEWSFDDMVTDTGSLKLLDGDKLKLKPAQPTRDTMQF
jgi:hypothetical protein